MPELLDFNSFGQQQSAAGAYSRAQADLGAVLPYASSYFTPAQPGYVGYMAPYQADSRSSVAKAVNFIGSVGSGIGHMAGAAATWLGRNTLNMAEAPLKLGAGLSHIGQATYDVYSQSNQSDHLAAQLDQLNAKYKSGQLSKSQYVSALKSWNQDSNNLRNDVANTNARLSTAGKDTVKSAIDTAAAVATIMTGGFGKAAEGAAGAARFLASDAVKAELDPVAANLSKLAVSKSVEALPAAAQQALNDSMASVVAGAGSQLTAGQLARAAAANLALKYPIYYNYLSSTSGDIYHKLDDARYGEAVRSLAFNAGLMLSGGPIGYALKYGGKAVGRVVAGTFVRSPFLDELSQQMFGDPAVIYKALTAIKDPALQKDVIQKFSDMEATNLGAVGQSEFVAAVNRVIDGMRANYGLDMTGLDPQTAESEIAAIYNHFQAQKLLSDEARRLGLSDLTAGRWDVRSISQVTKDILAGGDSSEARLAAFDTMVKQNPNQPWANNPYLIKQIRNLIQDKPGDQLGTALRSIPARQSVAGLSPQVVDKLAKLGYTPINVPNLSAPFKEGSGKLVSRFATPQDELFVRASQPLPILSHVGDGLTAIGLSPHAANSLVYDMFNANLTENIKGLSITQKLAEDFAGREAAAAAKTTTADIAGAADAWAQTGLSTEDIAYSKKFKLTPEEAVRKFGGGAGTINQSAASAAQLADTKIPSLDQATDYITKTLSNTAKDAKIKAADLRQLRRGEIARALNVDRGTAGEIQEAISQAMRDVPLQVRGLGDKVVDISYGAIKQYLRLQGAGRFAFNPFYRFMRLEPKTEILSEAEGGGIIRSVFSGQWREIGPLRRALRTGGFLDKTGGLGDVFSGEAVESTGASRNLAKSLTKNQERSIAGLIDVQARRMGMNWGDYLKAHPEDVKNTIQMIAEYDRHSDFLNSPMVKTLNIAIFPFRFETKVATIMARSLARSDMLTQVAFVNGLLKAHDYLNSPEGHAWYARNSNVIQLIGYITPLQEFNTVFNSLLPGHDHSLGNFGELGGLPFGFIPQLLDAEGLTHFNQAGIEPKTGDPFPKYVPASQKGQLAVALQDFIGSLWSYPGAKAGFPSKTSIDQGIAMSLVNGSKKADLQKLPPPALTAQQQQYKTDIQPAPQVQAAAANGAPPALPLGVPPTGSFNVTPRPLKPKAGSKKSFKPALLPGQTSYGQL